jgi:hypothetical protein
VRLARVKARLDPDNRVRFNHNIVPEARAAQPAWLLTPGGSG